jgi:hypothetical protein
MPRALIIAAALLAFAASAQAQSGVDGQWCLSSFGSGDNVNCSFETLASCMESKTSNSDTCSINPRAPSGAGKAKAKAKGK